MPVSRCVTQTPLPEKHDFSLVHLTHSHSRWDLQCPWGYSQPAALLQGSTAPQHNRRQPWKRCKSTTEAWMSFLERVKGDCLVHFPLASRFIAKSRCWKPSGVGILQPSWYLLHHCNTPWMKHLALRCSTAKKRPMHPDVQNTDENLKISLVFLCNRWLTSYEHTHSSDTYWCYDVFSRLVGFLVYTEILPKTVWKKSIYYFSCFKDYFPIR